jgi:hypothetical protein
MLVNLNRSEEYANDRFAVTQPAASKKTTTVMGLISAHRGIARRYLSLLTRQLKSSLISRGPITMGAHIVKSQVKRIQPKDPRRLILTLDSKASGY